MFRQRVTAEIGASRLKIAMPWNIAILAVRIHMMKRGYLTPETENDYRPENLIVSVVFLARST